MKGQTHGGKGCAQRPTNRDKFEANWASIFGNTLRGLRAADNVEVLEQKEVPPLPEQAHNTTQ